MPIHVDHDERRLRLAQAVWRIIERNGVSAASVRAVAREAGLSMGSVRHFFASQDELLVFAAEALVEQVRGRIVERTAARMALLSERPLDAVAALLDEVLPLDEERRVEATVWAAFTTPPVTPQIAVIRQHVDDGVRELCGNALDALDELGGFHAGRERAVELERVHALLDGLTLHLLVESTHLDPDLARAIVRTHLAELSSAPPMMR